MANTYVSKVVLGNETLIDLTADTITAANLKSGVTAHDSSGTLITGTAAVTVSGEKLVMPLGLITVPGSAPPPAAEDLLWTNPDPTVAFTPQTAFLSESLLDYEYIKIGYYLTVSKRETEYFDISYRHQLPADVTMKDTYTPGITYRATSYFYTRTYGSPSNTSIVFSDSIRQTTVLNTSLIPMHIWGVNF